MEVLAFQGPEAFISIAEKLGYDFEILKAVRNTNEEQKNFVLQKIKDARCG